MIIFYGFIIVTIVLLIYMYREAFSNRVIYHEFQFKSLPMSFKQIRIFFISDIHRRIISEKIIDEVMGKIDVVIIGGDLTERGVPHDRVVSNLKLLKKIGPVYFVWGNNDYEVNSHVLDATMLDLGVRILDNTTVSFESETGDHFLLVGIDDLTLNRDRLDLALSDCREEGFRLLVSHNPGIARKIQPEHGIGFVLSGHTHGGQIRIFGIGPYELGGVKRVGSTVLLTSNGYGTTAIPLRLEAKSETHVITLSHGDDRIVDPVIKIIK
jgi:uncharacterized protein